MVGTMSLEEQVDKDFRLARRKALLKRIGAHLKRSAPSNRLLCFDDLGNIREQLRPPSRPATKRFGHPPEGRRV
jgi:hypothetical protein